MLKDVSRVETISQNILVEYGDKKTVFFLKDLDIQGDFR